jgi:hypothetical protein
MVRPRAEAVSQDDGEEKRALLMCVTGGSNTPGGFDVGVFVQYLSVANRRAGPSIGGPQQTRPGETITISVGVESDG